MQTTDKRSRIENSSVVPSSARRTPKRRRALLLHLSPKVASMRMTSTRTYVDVGPVLRRAKAMVGNSNTLSYALDISGSSRRHISPTHILTSLRSQYPSPNTLRSMAPRARSTLARSLTVRQSSSQAESTTFVPLARACASTTSTAKAKRSRLWPPSSAYNLLPVIPESPH